MSEMTFDGGTTIHDAVRQAIAAADRGTVFARFNGVQFIVNRGDQVDRVVASWQEDFCHQHRFQHEREAAN